MNLDMEEKKLIFEGCVRVYLQGVNALRPIKSSIPSKMEYHIGSENTGLIVKDYRCDPVIAAQCTLSGETENDFADIFNQSAKVEVYQVQDGATIEMHEASADEISPLLWMGVIYDGKMSVHRIFWEILKPVDTKAIAFAALIER